MPKIDYIPVGDYLLPAITLCDPPNAPNFGLVSQRIVETLMHEDLQRNQPKQSKNMAL